MLKFLAGWEQFKAAFLEYRDVKFKSEQTNSYLRRNVICVHDILCILLFIALCSSLFSLFLFSLCLQSPWLINTAVPSYFAGGDRLSYRCRFPHYRTPLVTNTDSSRSTGPKSQLEKSEMQPLKLPSKDYPELLQFLPSLPPVSSAHCHHHDYGSQHDWFRVSRLQQVSMCAPLLY